MSLSSHQHSEHLLTLTTAPTETPVTLAEVKEHCRVDHVDDDVLLTSLIDAAVSYLDYEHGILGQAMVTQTWTYQTVQPHQGVNGDEVHFPVVPAISLTSMNYFDSDNVSQSITVTDYQLIASGWTAYIIPDAGIDWPTMYDRADALSIVCDAGFGAASAVPQSLKQAILLLIAHWYENRESTVVGTSINTVPMAFDAMVAPFRKVFVG